MILARAVSLIEDDRLLGPYFSGPSWSTHKAVLKAGAAIPLSNDELRLFHEVSGNRNPPTNPAKELWYVAGRRAGKDAITSAILVAAALGDYSKQVRPGETPVIAAIACDRDQAAVIFNYVRGYFEQVPALAALVADDGKAITKDMITLTNGNVIQVFPNSFRSVRGRTIVCLVFDEVAFFKDDRSANPDTELYNAIKPSTITVSDSVIVGISSPHRAAGLLFEKHREYFGTDDNNTLVVAGPSRTFNPTLDEKFIAEQLERDPAAGAAEWLGQFRIDLTSFLDPAWIERAAILDVGELMPPKGTHVLAAMDPSGGRKDTMACAISWMDGKRVVVGALRARKAPFEPYSVVTEFCDMLKRYGITKVHSDNYGAELVKSMFAEHGVTVVKSDKSTSDTFLEVEPLFAQGMIDIPNNPTLLRELRNLERSARASARDYVGHPKAGGYHDDLAVAVCKAAYEAKRAARKSRTVIPPFESINPGPARHGVSFENSGRRYLS